MNDKLVEKIANDDLLIDEVVEIHRRDSYTSLALDPPGKSYYEEYDAHGIDESQAEARLLIRAVAKAILSDPTIVEIDPDAELPTNCLFCSKSQLRGWVKKK